MTANPAGRIHTENILDQGCRDFTAAYMAVKYLASHVQDHPETITPRTIDVLARILESPRFDRQKQAFFLYQEAAEALVLMGCKTEIPTASPIIPRLLTILTHAQGRCLGALSQSLGKLPLPLSEEQPSLPRIHESDCLPLEINLETLTGDSPELAWQGRSLRVTKKNQAPLVIKFAISENNIPELVQEIRWMEFLNQTQMDPDIRLPSPMRIGTQILFKIRDPLPPGGPDKLMNGICIAFIPCPGYYAYPNEPRNTWSSQRIKAVFFKNASFLGYLARVGIFHSALIPLFHNRVQQTRRNDSGAYLWEHGGRLDQWLDSCRYPNFAASGPRDFEHLVLAENSRQLNHYIGEHLLSFILVLGSYFRNQAPERRGLDDSQSPCDTRDLFCQELFKEVVEGVCRAYFQGLVLRPCPREFDLAPQTLIEALVSAMGQDLHMEEVLRTRDQEEMTDEEFYTFLRDRGITRAMVKGKKEIVMTTGPHLGGFNQPISTPQLIDHLFRFSALCTAHRFLARANKN